MNNNNYDGRFDKLEDKLDKQDERLNQITEVLVRNTVSLEEHMRRTENLETRLEPVEKDINLAKFGFKGILWFCGGLISLIIALSKIGLLKLL